MEKISSIIPIMLGSIGILSLLVGSKSESFENMESYQAETSIFLNMYPKVTGRDYSLVNFIKKLKLNNNDTVPETVKSNFGKLYRTLNSTKKLPPVFIFPGIGASKIYAKWNKANSDQVKILNDTGSFEKSDEWSCREYQSDFQNIWFPSVNKAAKYCLAENLKVSAKDKNIVDDQGIYTITEQIGNLDFDTNVYDNLIDTLKAYGYTENENLFGVQYDFRKIGSESEINKVCMSISKLIERTCSLQEYPAVIIGHDLGSMIANYFLVNSDSSWKNQYIKSFISISGTFGGCPKALRTILSGDDLLDYPLNQVIKNFTGLMMMLPRSEVYGDNPIIHYNQVSYTSYDVRDLINKVSPEHAEIYDIAKTVTDKCMEPPGVPVYIVAGTDLNTESSYNYNKSLINDPIKNYPYYQIDLPDTQKFNYPDYFVGDSVMPKFALEYPIFWSKYQEQPVNYQFFGNAEHNKILSMEKPIKYILAAVLN